MHGILVLVYVINITGGTICTCLVSFTSGGRHHLSQLLGRRGESEDQILVRSDLGNRMSQMSKDELPSCRYSVRLDSILVGTKATLSSIFIQRSRCKGTESG